MIQTQQLSSTFRSGGRALAAAFLCALPAAALPAAAQDNLPEGHSSHGEAFNDGPRQAAYLMHGAGDVNFEVTALAGEAHDFFQQGVGQLHAFWYFEAERSFRQVLALDRDCAMAYWGLALANVEQPERARGFARTAWLKRGLVTKREQLYIDALARFHGVFGPDEPDEYKERERDDWKAPAAQLVKDYEEIIWEYPEDFEAKAFLVNRLWMNRRYGHATASRHMNEAVLQQIFARYPNHPAHHYRIHLWDAKDSAERVVHAAVSSGPSWPSAAHMWHMGGHIFARLGRHFDAAWQQEASARVDHAYMMRDWVLPDQIHNFSHNNEWLSRSMRHSGRLSEAIALQQNMIELPRHPKYNRLDKRSCSATWGRLRLLETLELFEQWDQVIELSETMYLAPEEAAKDRSLRASVLAKAYAQRGERESFEAQIAELEECLILAKLERAEAMDEAEEEALEEGLKPKEVEAAMQEALVAQRRGVDAVRKDLASLPALWDLLNDEELDAEGTLEKLEVLKENSNYPKAHLAEHYLAASQKWEDEKLGKEARKLALDNLKNKDGQLYALATAAHVLEALGDREQASEHFEELRTGASLAELEQPAFQRLRPLAQALELPADWTLPYEAPDDVASRSSMADLGPRHWRPVEAPEWTLRDGFGEEHALADYAGRPVIAIFFLGFSCVHCVEQLQAFAPQADAFRDAGIELVAIGNHTVEKLSWALGNDPDDTGYPFPILADPNHDLFRIYRAYDDFEDTALHGTYLIDGSGRLRWLDISYEPFMDWEFLLEESKRLLALPVRGEERSAALTR